MEFDPIWKTIQCTPDKATRFNLILFSLSVFHPHPHERQRNMISHLTSFFIFFLHHLISFSGQQQERLNILCALVLGKAYHNNVQKYKRWCKTIFRYFTLLYYLMEKVIQPPITCIFYTLKPHRKIETFN